MNNFAFIDSQNLYKAILEQKWKLDYGRFRVYLKDKYNIKKAFLFLGYLPENEWLYTKLQEAGFVIIFKPILEKPDGKVKGNVDAEMVLHTLDKINEYDKAIIITGDGDFHCLVKYLLKKKKLLKLIVPNSKAYSSLLRKFSKHIVFMNSLKNKLEYRKDR